MTSKLFLSLVTVAAFLLLMGSASATTIYVNASNTGTEDGTSEATGWSTIQKGINNATNGANDVILVMPGTYNENVTVNKSKLAIVATSGFSVTSVNTQVDADVFKVTKKYVNITGFTITNATGSGKSGIRLQKEYANISYNNITGNKFGLRLDSSNYSIIRDNYFSDNTQYGVRLTSSNNNTFSDNIANSNNYGIYLQSSRNNTFTNDTANSNGQEGFLVSSNSNNNTFSNVTANSNGLYGIDLLDSSFNIVKNSTTNSNTGGPGVLLQNASSNTITDHISNQNSKHGYRLIDISDNNTFSNVTGNYNSKNGMYLNESSFNMISNSTFNHNTDHGIRLRNASNNNTIDPTTANYNGKNGIVLEDSSGNTITGNTLKHNWGSAIQLKSSDWNTVSYNTIRNTTWGMGINLKSSDNNDILNNQITKTYHHGIRLKDSNNNTIANNNATRTKQTAGIVLKGSNNTVVRNNTANRNPRVGIALMWSSTNNTLEDNTLISNTAKGIMIKYSENNTVFNNTLSENGRHSIHLKNATNNTISNNTISSNRKSGIKAVYSNNNTLKYNTIDRGYIGIILGLADNNSVINNTITNIKSECDYLEVISSGNNITPSTGLCTRTGILDAFLITFPDDKLFAGSNATFYGLLQNTGQRGSKYDFNVTGPSDLDTLYAYECGTTCITQKIRPGEYMNITIDVGDSTPGAYEVTVNVSSRKNRNVGDVYHLLAIVKNATGGLSWDSTISSSTITGYSFVNGSTVTDSTITDSLIYNSTVTNSDLNDVELRNATVINDEVINGTLIYPAVGSVTYEITSATSLSSLLGGRHVNNSDLVGLENETLFVNATSASVDLNISAGQDYSEGSLEVTRSGSPPSGVDTLSNNVGGYADITPSDNVQNSSAWTMIRFYYNQSDLGSIDESTLRLRHYNSTTGQWESMSSSSVNTVENYVWGNTTSFSVFGISGAVSASTVTTTGAGGGGGGVTIPPRLGAQRITVTPGSVASLVNQFLYFSREFYVVPAELAGVLGSLGHVPTTAEMVEELDKELTSPVKTIMGEPYLTARLTGEAETGVEDPYTIASEKVLQEYSTADMVVIARGDLGIDSLAAVAYAKALKAPILLVKPGGLPSVTEDALSKLGTKETIILGGPEAVREEVATMLPEASRIGGSDRYDTAVKIAEALEAVQSIDTIVITDGLNPDMTSVMLAEYYRAPIVYVMGEEVPRMTKEYLEQHKINGVRRILTVGIPEEAEEMVKELTTP